MRLHDQRRVALPPFSFGAILVAFSFAVSLAAGSGVTLAGAASLGDWLAEDAVASTLPAMLAPITSVGRKAWNCKAELAASAPHVDEAELPSSGATEPDPRVSYEHNREDD
jgi:hypothetical protein